MDTLRQAGGTVVQFHAVGSAAVKAAPGEARVALRRRVLKAGVIASQDRHLTSPCTVRDVSSTGARLRVEGSVGVPDRFELIIEVDGLEVNCEVAWRKASDVGVRFLAAPRIVAARRIQVVNALVPQQRPSLRRKPTLDGPVG